MLRRVLVVAASLILAAPAQAQQAAPRPPKAPLPPVTWSEHPDLADLDVRLDALRSKIDLDLAPLIALKLEPAFEGLSRDLASLELANLADVWQATAGQHVKIVERGGDLESTEYSRGVSSLDKGRYQEALASFEKVVAASGKRADAGLYWKAYSLNRLGRGPEALVALDDLLKKYPSSRWANDARALQAEIRQASGRPANPAQESDEELKLIALNSLVMRDAERGLPLVEQIINGSASPRMKERALFVLAQSGSPRAKTLLTDIAKGKGNPDLQMKALDYLGGFGSGPDVPLLADIYRSTTEVDVKKRVIRSLAMSGGRRAFYVGDLSDEIARAVALSTGSVAKVKEKAGTEPAIAKLEEEKAKAAQKRAQAEIQYEVERAMAEAERVEAGALREVREAREARETRSTGARVAGDPERNKARQARAQEAADTLWKLYEAESSPELKREILRNMYIGDQSGRLIQIVRTEKDPDIRRAAVQAMMFSRSPKTSEPLLALYREEKDTAVKRQIIDSLAVVGGAGSLVQIARQETDPQLKRTLVQRLSTMKDKEATDYMMELLKK